MIRDLVRAARRLRARPASAAAIVLTLALGIGASVGMFSVLHGVVLRALPYPDDDRLVLPYVVAPNLSTFRAGFTVTEAEGLARVPGFEALAYYGTRESPYTFMGRDVLRSVPAARVSASFFPLFAVPAEIGRTFIAADFEQGRPVAVLSYEAWVQLTGGDPGAVGRTLDFEEGAFELVGVLPASFEEPSSGDVLLYLPFLGSDLERPAYKFGSTLAAVGRLAPGVTRSQALAALAARLDAVNAERGTSQPGQRYGLVRLIDDLLGNVSTVLFGLFAVSLLVLLIACSTAGSLVGIRFEQRATELAVRRALGAGSARIVRAAGCELVLLAAAAAAGGVLVAELIVLALRPLAAASLPRADGIAVDGATLLFAAAVAAATVLLTGAASLSSLLGEPGSRLRAGVPQLVEGGRRSGLLPVAAVGMSVVALASALALSASEIRLSAVNPGVRTSNVVALRLGLLLRRAPAEVHQAADRVLEAVRAMPGVADAAFMQFGLPTDAGISKGHGRRIKGGDSVMVGVQFGSESYHRLLRIPIVRGRDFAATDLAGGTRVAVINETLARALFPGTDPIGQTMYVAGNEIPFEIVGIAADRRNAGLRAPPEPEVVGSSRQWDTAPTTLLVRFAGTPPAGWAKLLEAKVNEVDPGQPVVGGIALDDDLGRQTRALRLFAFATNCFAVLALVLCALGVNAVIAAAQQRRQRELGLRMALGASPRQAGALVLGTAARIVGFGLVLAVLLAVPAFRWLRSQLFEVGPAAFWTLFAAAALLSAAAGLLAALWPARRAARVAPMQALRCD
jgi:predicted permease